MKEIHAAIDRIRSEVHKAVVGQEEVLDGLLMALLVGGHVLLEGNPGTAKTLLARAMAAAIRGSFRRIQFTPDLMPSDVTGTSVFRPATQEFEFRRGPVFADILLADEINRAPAKTQSALLEAMQERSVTVDGVRHALPPLFLCLATQNPIEYEGTYPLPEAQQDRFLFKVLVPYPRPEDETEMLRRYRDGRALHEIETLGIEPCAGPEDVLRWRAELTKVTVDDRVVGYIQQIVAQTRQWPSIAVGAGPRAAVHLLLAARGHAVLAGREFVTPDDVAAVAPAALRHRLILRAEAEIEGRRVDEILKDLLQTVKVPR